MVVRVASARRSPPSVLPLVSRRDGDRLYQPTAGARPHRCTWSSVPGFRVDRYCMSDSLSARQYRCSIWAFRVLWFVPVTDESEPQGVSGQVTFCVARLRRPALGYCAVRICSTSDEECRHGVTAPQRLVMDARSHGGDRCRPPPHELAVQFAGWK
jgi:hypothetical protein